MFEGQQEHRLIFRYDGDKRDENLHFDGALPDGLAETALLAKKAGHPRLIRCFDCEADCERSRRDDFEEGIFSGFEDGKRAGKDVKGGLGGVEGRGSFQVAIRSIRFLRFRKLQNNAEPELAVQVLSRASRVNG